MHSSDDEVALVQSAPWVFLGPEKEKQQAKQKTKQNTTLNKNN